MFWARATFQLGPGGLPSTQRSQIVAFVSELVTTCRFGNALIRGALHEAKRQGHVLFIAETAGEPGAALEAVDALIDRQVDGIIFAATRPEQLEVPDHSQEGYAAVREILDACIRPRAHLPEENLHIPDDVSIVSFEDDDIAVYLEPKLTTAAFTYEQMGEMAVRVILEGGTPQPEYLVEMPIRVRGSVKLRQ